MERKALEIGRFETGLEVISDFGRAERLGESVC